MSTALPELLRTRTDDLPWSARMANAMIRRHPPEQTRWHYEHGLLLMAIRRVGQASGDPSYGRFVRAAIDPFVGPDGTIRTYRIEEYNLDQINPGKLLFDLYRETGDARYRRALALLREQLRGHPRTNSGGLWHKQIYPFQMWLDGIYMASPFYAEYGRTFGEPEAFDDVAHQIELIEARTRDPRTGLLYHAWDESRLQRWADPETGCSPHFWGRAVGWYAMALVDTLDLFPADHPRRPAIQAILGRLAEAVVRVQDPASGLWFQVLDQGERPGNYLEASAACMLVYGLARGVRQGYLPARFAAPTRAAYAGILRELIGVDAQGQVSLERVCAVAGLGGSPYRDGSFDYYVGEAVCANDYKGVGPFILASLELEQALPGDGAGR